MKKCWNLLLALSMLLTMCAWSLPVSAEEPVPGTNLLKGGYSWVWNSSWGNTTGVVIDGDLTTSTRVNRTSGNSYIAAAIPTALGIQKFNKIRLFFHKPEGFSPATYAITTYTSAGDADPGESCDYSVKFGSGNFLAKAAGKLEGTQENIISYEYDQDGVLPQQMAYEFTTPIEGRIFYFTYAYAAAGAPNAVTTNTTFGLYEMEAYYVTPADVKWDSEETAKTVLKPVAGETSEMDVAYSVYDQLGDKLGDNLQAAFPGTLELKESYAGVTLEDGKLKVTSDCTTDTIELLYIAKDSDNNTVLEKTLSVGVVDEISATIAYLEGQIPAETQTNLTLPTSYMVEGNTVSISWQSSNTSYIAADGTVTRPSYETGDQTVTLTASITPSDGSTAQTKNFTVKVIRAESAAKVTLDAAKTALKWDVLSNETTKTVTRDLTLPVAVDGKLNIGGIDYAGVNISWKSSDETTISTTGAVTRKVGGGRSTLTATLSIANGSEEPLTDTVTFSDIVVLAKGTEHNIMYGGYSWGAWGNWNGALDGCIATSSGIGKHSAQTNPDYPVAFVTGGDHAAKKYNKLVLYFSKDKSAADGSFNIDDFRLDAYTAGLSNDPGKGASVKPAISNPEGEVNLLSYEQGKALLEEAENNENYRVVVNLDAPQQSKYFVFGWRNANNLPAGGLSEFEAFYAKPASVSWDNPNSISMVVPRAGSAPSSYDLPAYTVYDELDDEVTTGFTATWALTENYTGVTLADNKITLSSDCTVNEILLTYTSKDNADNTTCLTQQLTIPLAAASNDYVDVTAAADYLQNLIPETTTEDITLPTSYTGTNPVSISWATDNANYIAADGKVTRPSGATGDVTVKLTATITCGTETITREYPVQVEAEEATAADDLLKEAAEALIWDVISDQNQTAIGKALLLPRAQNGTLTLGEKSYSGVNISWNSSNPEVLSNKGNVTRQAEATALTLTATLSATSGGQQLTLDVPFDITVAAAGTAVNTKNIMAGGYGWVTGGWGTASNAVDGKRNTAWSLGEHSQTSIAAGLKTASGEIEKYNKVNIYFYLTNHLLSYDVTGYTQTSSDPGKGASAAFAGGSGGVAVISYDAENPATIWDEDGKVSVSFKEAKQSRYFGVTLANSAKDEKNSNNTGIYELEAYYLTPNEVRWNDETQKVYKPRSEGEITSFDLPEYTVYDEFGDKMVDESFTGEWSLAETYTGVTFADGKISLTSACNTDGIDLIYTSKDADKTWLQQTLTIPVGVVNNDYYTMMAVADYLDTQILPQATGNLNMLTSKDGVSVVWTSDDEECIATDGTVTRPAYGTEDKNVTLTAELSIGEFKFTKTYTVKVIQNATDEQIALMDANRIDLGVKGIVSSDIELPTTGYYGSTITWSSDKSNVISAEGKYTLTQGTGNSTPVKLTATVTFDGKIVKKDFTVYAKTTSTGGSIGGGGGVGGGRGSSGSKTIAGNTAVNIPPAPLTNDQLEQGLFADVPSGHWAKSYIEELAGRKIINGIDSSHYEPEREITREEFLKLVIMAFGFTLKPDNIAFTDVVSGEWYADYVATAYKEGLINGMTETEFGIGRSITRQDAIVILERVLTKRGTEYTGVGKEYTDVGDIADYAARAVENLTIIGIVEGNEEGNFLPQNHTTRADAAKIIYAAMKQGGLW